jgi:beta-lactam-binding protein with PASTA domain
VPNVLGDSPAAATTALAASGLDVLFAGGQNGAVVSQSPAANSRVPEHSTVVLTTQ